MATRPTKPQFRSMSFRSLVNTVAGAEQPTAVYHFSGRQFFERPTRVRRPTDETTRNP